MKPLPANLSELTGTATGVVVEIDLVGFVFLFLRKGPEFDEAEAGDLACCIVYKRNLVAVFIRDNERNEIIQLFLIQIKKAGRENCRNLTGMEMLWRCSAGGAMPYVRYACCTGVDSNEDEHV